MTLEVKMIDFLLDFTSKIVSKINMWCWKWQVHRRYYKKKK